jgi:hypothetical protein
MRHIWKGIAGLALFVTALAIQTGTAHAGWNQNHIIDDNVFSNSTTMNSAQIDAFLNAFPSSCISPNKGFSAPVPSGYTPSGGYTYGGNGTAGQVIATASQVYGINPQVLLVTLQKEQSLVGGQAGCSVQRYAGATGLGCPDGGTTHDYTNLNLYSINGNMVTAVSGTCVNAAQKAGFSQQIIRSAWLLKFSQERSLGNVGWAVITGSWDNSDDPQSCYSGPMTAGYRQVCPSGATNYYDGYRTIDGQAVQMETGATAALYYYTPHFHGNQNFVALWEAWWGQTLLGTYKWATNGYQILTADNSAFVDPGHLQPGQRYLAKLPATNTGTATWYKSGPTPMVLGATGGNSKFCVPGKWIACTRPAGLTETSVAPGGLGHFIFEFQAPFTPGEYRENFKPLAEMLAWTNDIYGMTFGIKVDNPGTFKWSMHNYQVLDKNESAFLDPGRLEPGETYIAKLQAFNTGTATWQKGGATPMVLGSQSSSPFCLPSWMACNRPASLIESSVPPGGSGHFKFQFQAPYGPGEYRQDFQPLAEFLSWTAPAPNQTFGIKVNNPGTFKWGTPGYQILTEDNSQFMDPGNLQPNTVYLAKILAYNNGTATWKRDGATPMRLGRAGNSVFCNNAGWLACNRPVGLYEASVPPGGAGHFIFKFRTPATPGTYREDFKPLAEMLSWTNDTHGQTFGVIVR